MRYPAFLIEKKEYVDDFLSRVKASSLREVILSLSKEESETYAVLEDFEEEHPDSEINHVKVHAKLHKLWVSADIRMAVVRRLVQVRLCRCGWIGFACDYLEGQGVDIPELNPEDERDKVFLTELTPIYMEHHEHIFLVRKNT